MCLAVIALDAHPRYAVVLAANRDEFHARPAKVAHWWNDAGSAPILAGRDLAQGGTWLGLARDGRWAFVTNVREPSRFDPLAPSRGSLVPALLRDPRPLAVAFETIVGGAHGYNGFNLVAGDAAMAAFGSNRGPRAQALVRGIHGISNAGLDTPWPKLVRARTGLAAWVASRDDSGPCSKTACPRVTMNSRTPEFRGNANASSRRRSSSAKAMARGARRSSHWHAMARRDSSSAASTHGDWPPARSPSASVSRRRAVDITTRACIDTPP
jgi:hypothetical protein